MAKFYFSKEELVKVWRNVNFEVEAETVEEAGKLVEENFKDKGCLDEIARVHDADYFWESEDTVMPENNNGHFTVRIKNNDTGKVVCTNAAEPQE